MANGGAAATARWLLAPVLALAAGVGGAADLEAAWDAYLRGRLLQAQALLESDAPATPAHRLALAAVALELGDLDRAGAALEPLTADAGHPDYPCAALLLGRLHLAAGRDGAARDAFSDSLARSADGPYAAAAHLALIRLDLHAGAFDAAGERLDRLADLGLSPELEIAVDLVSPDGGSGPVRPFPSPLGLFAAARLADGVEAPPLASPLPAASVPVASSRPIADVRARPSPAGDSGGERTGVGLQPITAAEVPTTVADASRERPNAPTRTRRGLVSVPATPSRDGLRFTLRLGSFRDPIHARHMAEALQDAGFTARTRVHGDFHRVLVGAAATRAAAERLLQRVQEIGYDGDVVPYPADAER